MHDVKAKSTPHGVCVCAEALGRPSEAGKMYTYEYYELLAFIGCSSARISSYNICSTRFNSCDTEYSVVTGRRKVEEAGEWRRL